MGADSTSWLQFASEGIPYGISFPLGVPPITSEMFSTKEDVRKHW